MRNLIMEILERIAISMFFSLFPSLLVCVQNFQTRAIDQDTEVTSNQGFFIFFQVLVSCRELQQLQSSNQRSECSRNRLTGSFSCCNWDSCCNQAKLDVGFCENCIGFHGSLIVNKKRNQVEILVEKFCL